MDMYLSIGEIYINDGSPRDVGTRWKVKIVLNDKICVSAKSVETILHIERTGVGTTPQFKTVNGRTESALELDADCAKSVQITKWKAPPPLH
jgi:hypothetical protein